MAEIDVTEHGRDQVDGEQIIGICKEPDSSDHASPDVEPTKLCIVDFCQCVQTTFTWVVQEVCPREVGGVLLLLIIGGCVINRTRPSTEAELTRHCGGM